MTLSARDIIKSGLRKLASLASGDDPTPEEMNDGFLALNRMLRALHGTVIGPRLSPQPMTATMQAENGGLYQLALAGGAATLTAPGNPKSGARFGVIDTAGNLATFPLTINRNGQLFQGVSSSPEFNTPGFSGIWFFDADTGNWSLEADLADVNKSPPYPERLVALLPDMFAVFISGEFGAELSPDVISGASLGMASFARVYGRRGRNGLDRPMIATVPQPAPQGA